MSRAGRAIKAIVFDLDGVIVDSEPVWEEVRRQLVAERGGRWLPDSQRRLMGMSTAEWSAYLASELGVGMSPEQVAAEVVKRMEERYRRSLPLLPGAVEAVPRLAERWPLAVASSSPQRLIDVVREGAGLSRYFHVRVSTEEVARGKPAPDVYLEAAARLRVAPGDCLAVEDSSNGLRSAGAAGLRLVAIPRPQYPPEPDALAHADLVLEDLGELTPEVVDRLESRAASGGPGPPGR
jgi:HAD superfamily hydrolase (TIGR01509 family)